MAAVEAQIDFSDVEDADGLTLDAVKRAARAAIGRIDRALATAGAAERLREGFTVVIAGPPNVGKSTLMNALAGREVAITSPIPGTTRDLIEVFLDLRGYPVTLVDTAGIRDSADPIEQEGVARARRRAASADLTLWLDDGAGGETPSVGSPSSQRPHQDRPRRDERPGRERGKFAISAKTGAGVDQLLDALADLAEERMSSREPASHARTASIARFRTPATPWLRRSGRMRRNGN